MITTKNYFQKTGDIKVSQLPDDLKEAYDFVKEVTENHTSWNYYNLDADIKATVDGYLANLSEFLKDHSSGKQSEPVIPKPERAKKLKSERNIKSKSDPNLKLVENIRQEVRFIKRFVGLHNKSKSPQQILALIKSLQRAIVQKLIRKTSPLAKYIDKIQEFLISAYEKMKGNSTIELDKANLSKLVAIAGGEKVYPSINIIKRYISLQGKPVDHATFERFSYQIASALSRTIMKDDPYADKVQEIYTIIKKSRNEKKFALTKSELRGLEGIVDECSREKGLGHIYHIKGNKGKKKNRKKLRACNRGTFSDAKGKGACSHNRGLAGIATPSLPGNPRILTAEQMGNRHHDVLDFTSFWYALFGKPEKSFVMMLHGEPHNGKTILLLKFAKYLAENFGRVLYVTSEEFDSSAMTGKINELVSPKPEGLHFIDSIESIDLSPYDFVILDSVNDLGLKPNDFKAIVKQYSPKGYILNLQHTKSGQFKGGKDWEHIPAIVGEVSKGIVWLTKNRYGQKNTFNFFEQFGLQWEEPKPTVYIPNEKLLPDSNQENDTSDNETIY
jgi:hypothetical protein